MNAVISGVLVTVITAVLGLPFAVGVSRPERFEELSKFYCKAALWVMFIGAAYHGGFIHGIGYSEPVADTPAWLPNILWVALGAGGYHIALSIFGMIYVEPALRDQREKDLREK